MAKNAPAKAPAEPSDWMEDDETQVNTPSSKAKVKTNRIEKSKEPKAPRERKPRAPKLKTEAELIAKYPQVVKNTLRKEGNKQMVTIKTLGLDDKPDGNTRDVFTSDLFQVKHTEETLKILRKLRRRKDPSEKKPRVAKAKAEKAPKAEKPAKIKPRKAKPNA